MEKRLVLGFDAGCFTCSELARRIEERAGDKIEVRGLDHPRVEHWRYRALGENARWTPTLFEVASGDEVKAWTGAGPAAKPSRTLGALSTWRVMQALDEIGKPKTISVGDSTPAAEVATAGVSRGLLLKGMGGSALGVLAGVCSPAQAAPEEEADFDEFIEVFAAIEEIPDAVVRQGDEAVKKWLRRRLGPGEPSPRVFRGCARAIGFALDSVRRNCF